MSKRNNEDRKHSLALDLAGGGTVAGWARKHEVPKRTAYTWARSPEVKQRVASIRRRAIDRAIGRLARNATAAAGRLVHLAHHSGSDAVQLHAARAVLNDLMTITDHHEFEKRLAALERRAQANAQGTGTPPEAS